jgi:hypothetical protein
MGGDEEGICESGKSEKVAAKQRSRLSSVRRLQRTHRAAGTLAPKARPSPPIFFLGWLPDAYAKCTLLLSSGGKGIQSNLLKESPPLEIGKSHQMLLLNSFF